MNYSGTLNEQRLMSVRMSGDALPLDAELPVTNLLSQYLHCYHYSGNTTSTITLTTTTTTTTPPTIESPLENCHAGMSLWIRPQSRSRLQEDGFDRTSMVSGYL